MTSRHKTGLIILGTVILLTAAYLNRTYAHIYGTIEAVGLKAPARGISYELAKAEAPAPSDETEATEPVPTTEPAPAPTRVAFVGDSLTAGVGVSQFTESYPYLTAKAFTANVPIVLTVHAVPGYKTADALRELAPAAVAAQPETVFLLIGANDIHGRTSLADFRRDYAATLEALQVGASRYVFAVTVPSLGSSHLLYQPYSWYFQRRTDQFNEVIKELASRRGDVKVIDLSGMFKHQIADKSDFYSKDEFHPSAKGYELWAKYIYDIVSR